MGPLYTPDARLINPHAGDTGSRQVDPGAVSAGWAWPDKPTGAARRTVARQDFMPPQVSELDGHRSASSGRPHAPQPQHLVAGAEQEQPEYAGERQFDGWRIGAVADRKSVV